MATCFELVDNVRRELVITGLKRGGRSFDARLDSSRFEDVYGLVEGGFLKDLCELFHAVVTVPRLLGHCLVDHAADEFADGWVDCVRRGRNLLPDGFDDFFFRPSSKWLAAGQCLITNDAQGKDVGLSRYPLVLNLF